MVNSLKANNGRGGTPPRGDEVAPYGDSDIFALNFHIVRGGDRE